MWYFPNVLELYLKLHLRPAILIGYVPWASLSAKEDFIPKPVEKQLRGIRMSASM